MLIKAPDHPHDQGAVGPMLNNLLCWDVYAPKPTFTKFPGVEAFLERYRAAAEKEKTDPLGLYCAPPARLRADARPDAPAGGRPPASARSTSRPSARISTRARSRPCLSGDLKFDGKGEWQQERNLYVQYQGVERGMTSEQFKKPGVEVILYPDQS